MPDTKSIMNTFLTALHYATCGTTPKPVRHSMNPPPVTVGELEALRTPAGAANAPSAPAGVPPRTTSDHGVRTRLGVDASQPDRNTFKSLLAASKAGAATPCNETSSSADGAALGKNALLDMLNRKLRAVVSDQDLFNEASHHLLHELMNAPRHVQRPVAQMVLDNFREHLSPLARKSADAIIYSADVYDRYHPEEGLPRQYGWEVSPVSRGLYDVQIAAMRAKGTLAHPLYRTPRLDQLAAQLAKWTNDPHAPAHGFAIARMASFFHQVGFFFHIDKRSGRGPMVHIMPVDSERRGKEIALQLRAALQGGNCKANIAGINGGTQFAPAGCPMFSPFNIESLNADPRALDALMAKMIEGQPLHAKHEYVNNDDPDIPIAVYSGEHLLWPAFYAICQSKTVLRTVANREQFPDEIGLLNNFENAQREVLQDPVSGKTRKVNFKLERTHEERTGVMLDYLKSLLEQPAAEASDKLVADIIEVRQSSHGDNDDLKMDRPCAAGQLADKTGEPVVWIDISPLMQDNQRWNQLLDELDRTDGPRHMKLGYLHKQGFPVFSDWYVGGEEDRLYLKDDRYFHIFPEKRDQQMRPSEYMRTDSGSRAGATYNFVAFPKSAFENDRPAFIGLAVNEVMPRLPAGGDYSEVRN